MTTRAQIVDEAREWIDTPYKHQQRMKRRFCDCYGLLLGVAINCGVAHAQEVADNPAYHGYGHYPDPTVMRRGLLENMDRVPISTALPADVLWMRFDRDPRHFAMVSSVDPLRIIHAYAQARKVTESAANVWGGVIVSAWRFRGLDG